MLRLLLALAVLLACVFGLYRGTLDYSLFGHDTYTVIEASRIESWSDFLGTFREPLMDGQFAIAYFRPTQNLSIALDWALSGLDPFGYQLSSLVVFAAGVLGVFFLTRRLLPGRPALAPLLAALAFAAYPTHWELLPVASRRNHLLCLAFFVWTLWAQLSPRALAPGKRGWLAGVLALFALGSNEIALVLAPLCVAVVFVCSEREGFLARVEHAFGAALPALGALVLVLIARVAVLSGVGGPDSVAAENVLKGERLFDLVLFPQPALADSLAWKLALGAILGLFAAALLLARGRADDEPEERAPGTWRALAVLALWLAAVALPILAAGSLRPWYALHPAAALSVLLGLAAHRFLPRPEGVLAHPVLLIGLVPIGLVLFLMADASPMRVEHPQWDTADRRVRRFFDDLEPALEHALPGDTIRSQPVPVRVLPPARRPGRAWVRSPAVLGPLSIPSWVRLRFPGRPIRAVLSNAKELPPPDPSYVLLILDVDREG